MTQNILIVEDDEEMRHALCEALKSYGYNVSFASDGEEGLKIFKSSDFNIVITDIKMPRMNGFDLLREIRKHNARIPVIIITAYGSVEDAVNSMREGAYDYLMKPFSLSALEQIVEKALNKSEPLRHPSLISSSRGTPKTNRSKIIFIGQKMKQVLNTATKIAPNPSTVLLLGESGTGKELMARFIHAGSDRSNFPFVAINCAALPKDLLESELFGYEKGAFTGAMTRKIGKFELADRGTILLDEISEMDVAIQAKLLRVLQEKEVDRVGGSRPIPINVRVIATTNRNLDEMVEQGQFREDLFYRLNVIPITIPPLRERREDIPLLIDTFLQKHSKRTGKKVTGVSHEAMKILTEAHWKGNVRELENVIERGILLCDENIVTVDSLMIKQNKKAPLQVKTGAGETLWEMEKQLIISTLDELNDNRTRAAERLGISIRTLRNKLNEYKEKNLI